MSFNEGRLGLPVVHVKGEGEVALRQSLTLSAVARKENMSIHLILQSCM